MTDLHQLTLDEIARARRTDPATSKDAARQAGGLAAEHQRIILGVMQMRAHTGEARDWTADQIAEWCDLDRHQVGRRLGELERNGLVRVTGNQRPTPRGRLARCYEVTT